MKTEQLRKKKHIVGWLNDYRALALQMKEKSNQIKKPQKIIG
jgi:hypothetical protein